MSDRRKVALITGITGQDGSYLAELLLAIFLAFFIYRDGPAMAGRVEAVARRLAREQRGAQLFFQRLDAPRHRGVLHAQAARRSGQGAGTGEFEKVAQVVPVHACLIVQICKAKVQV